MGARNLTVGYLTVGSCLAVDRKTLKNEALLATRKSLETYIFRYHKIIVCVSCLLPIQF